MKLYYSPGACSLAVHITLREAGLPFELVQVNLKEHKTLDGKSLYDIHSKGYVPILALDSGEVLTEGIVINQYLSDQVPGKRLLPAVDTLARYRALEWLNYTATELHKACGPLFTPGASEESKQQAKDRLVTKFKLVEDALQGKQYIMGDQFSIADAYIFTVLRWIYALKVPIDHFANIKAYFDRVKSRPSVQEALAVEGLKA